MRKDIARVLFMGALLVLATTRAGAAPNDPQSIADGKYLVAAGDCAGCHTAPGGAPFAGGTVIETPFGKLLGPNITPDQATGIGTLTDDEFISALKYGRAHDGKRLYPGMPYVYYNRVSRDDILKIRAYLNSLPPVDHKIVADQLPFPFNVRLAMLGWNTLFFHDGGDFQPDPSQSASWNRGAYLVQGLGHCAACHTSKNALGGDHTGQEFQGGVVDGANAPALVNDRTNGLGFWSADDIGTYLKTGHNQFAGASGPMADVITYSTSNLTLADDKAIGTYLKSLPPAGAAPAPIAASDPTMLLGASIYADQCAACHTGQGTGLPGLFPALKGDPVVAAADPLTIVSIVLHGGRNVSTPAAAGASMPAFGALLNNAQIADVLTYIRNGWGNAAPAISAGQVNQLR